MSNAVLAPTPAQIEGPYWKPGSPERSRLAEPGVPGEPLVLTGRVLTSRGEPVGGAWVDVWHCDGAGVYDIDGYTLRGHQYTARDGSYRVETVLPSAYSDSYTDDEGKDHDYTRTPHIHIKVKARARETLTTQLYFPGEELNEQDSIFVPECIVEMGQGPDGKSARFDFVLK